MTYGGNKLLPDTVTAHMEDQPADVSSIPHADAIPPPPAEPALSEDLLHLDRVWTLKRLRSVSPDAQAIYHSLPASPKAARATTNQGEGPDSLSSAHDISFLVPSVADFDSALATASTEASGDRHQRAHSQPSTFEHDTESDLGPPAKKRRLFQHEHYLETGAEHVDPAHSGDTQGQAGPLELGVDAGQQDDDIAAQLMASLQQAAEDTDFAVHVDNLEGGDHEQTLASAQAAADESAGPVETPQELSEHHEQHDFQPDMEAFPHEDLLNAFIGASAAASPVPPDTRDQGTEQTAGESTAQGHGADVAPEPIASSPKDVTLASAAAQLQSPTNTIVIDPALTRTAPNPVRSSHPFSPAPVPVIPVAISNSRPVPTNPLTAVNGISRSSSAALTSRSPSATGPRPVVPSPYHHLNRPVPKKPSRDFTPARPTDKRRPTPRRSGGRGASLDPYQPPLASSLSYQASAAARNSQQRPSDGLDETNIAATLSPETLTVLEAAATTLSQIQGPITQEHLEAIVLQLTNAGIDLAQLGLGGLLAQDEEEDTPLQEVNRLDMNAEMASASMPSDFATHGFGDVATDSQPDDMNLQAQSLIAALSALVPQSQTQTDQVSRAQEDGATREAPITIDLTDEPDDEPAVVSDPKVTGPSADSTAGEKSIDSNEPDSGEKLGAKKDGTTPAPVTPETGDITMSETTEDLDQEKARILKLDRHARIELLEKLVLELEKEVTSLSEPEKISAASPNEQDSAAKQNGATDSTEDQATVIEGVSQEDPSAKNPLSDSPGGNVNRVVSDEQKRKTEQLEFYRGLLLSAKTESPSDPVLPSPSINNPELAPGTPNIISPGTQEPAAASPAMPVGDPNTSADKPENTSAKHDDANGTSAPLTDDENAQNTADREASQSVAPPEVAKEQQKGDHDQAKDQEEPVIVKSEPVDIDFTVLAGAEAAGTSMPEPAQVGEASNQPSDDTNHQPPEHDNAAHPADASMEEDPLLAELFPTFPMGDSPMQAHQTQTEEEADPLLAGMLQELDASNGHDNLGYDGADHDNFTAGWNPWAEVPHVIPETIVQVASAFDMDPDPHKMNLGLIGFREDSGRIFVPPTTRQTERQLYGRGGPQHDALPIEGFGPFLQAGIRMAYGSDSKPYREARIAAIQAVSITGALRLGGTFLARFPLHLGMKSVFVPNPTTGEDARALHEAGLDVKLYRFFDRANGGVDFPGMCEDLAQAPEQSIVLLHVSGSSPTGASLVISQWRALIDIIKAGRHIPLLVMEFQGLASGDPNIDAHPVRYMTQEGIPFMLAQSFDSAMGLYIDSPSIVSVVTNSHQEKLRIESQMRHVARTLHSHPGPLGAHIAAGILNDSQMYRSWLKEIKAMSDRLRSIREKLYDYLTHKLRTPGVWTHFRGSRGMYSAVLLDPMQIRTLATREHIHLLPDGCFSLGCLNAAKIEQLARAIDRVVRDPEVPMMGGEEEYLGAVGDEETTLRLEMALQESFPGYE